ncbi:D-sedoheptulose-7-phosphate isomerase [Leptospirillum ferriphilum]|uniref:D-sedoheptulose-7-phosphate isomerase n=1 Tax=Leptospirillum ferriphilum TaxID=178606 RepID=UPI0006B22DC4|nr:D-sedoheptulose 7-phosphate isomerase [Leptospirillum ferriphilum]
MKNNNKIPSEFSKWPSRIEFLFQESMQAKKDFVKDSLNEILECGAWMTETLRSGKKILIFGNGGSSSDAMHIAGELVSRFYKERRGLPAIALGTNMATLTSISNDYSYENVFAREIDAYGEAGDLAIGISTSGNSRNVLKGIEKAKEKNMKTVAFSGGTGGQIRSLADLSLIVPSKLTPRIQECHITVGHILCELVEEALFVS